MQNALLKKLLEYLVSTLIEKFLNKETLDKLEVQLKVMIVKALKELAKSSEFEMDDELVEALAKAWNVEVK